MNFTTLLKGAAIFGAGYVLGKASGMYDCLDNILVNNPEMEKISYNSGKTLFTRYQKAKNDQE